MVTILLRSIWGHAEKVYRGALRAGTITLTTQRAYIELINRPAEARHQPGEAWTVEQPEAFQLAAKDVYAQAISNVLYPVFHTAIAAGLRRGELLGLRRSDLATTSERHVLTVRRHVAHYGGKHHEETPKSQAGTRRVP